MFLAMKTRMLSCQMGNGQGNGNENVKKKVQKAKQQFCTCSTLFGTFLCCPCTSTTWNILMRPFGRLPRLRDIFFLFFLLNSGEVPWNSTLEKFTCVWHFKRIGKNRSAIKIEKTEWIYFNGHVIIVRRAWVLWETSCEPCNSSFLARNADENPSSLVLPRPLAWQLSDVKIVR